MKALKISTAGVIEHIDIQASDSLATLQAAVGGYIEVLELTRGVDLVINEEGKLDGLEHNTLADMLVQGYGLALRPGDFIVAPGDLDVMRAEIDAVRAAGLAGVVLGASRPGGALDEVTLRALIAHAAGLGTTLHRAVDLVPDFDAAVDLAADLGFERILTSGGARHAAEGMDTIAAMIERAAGRIIIMAGSGVRPANVGALLARLPLTQVHASCSAPARPTDEPAIRLGFASPSGKQTSAAIVAELKQALTR